MITEHDIRRKDGSILLGISIGAAVLDIVTTEAQLQECLDILEHPPTGLVRPQIGMFGVYPISLALGPDEDEAVALFVDGPLFEPFRDQSAAIWLGKEELRELILEVLRGETKE